MPVSPGVSTRNSTAPPVTQATFSLRRSKTPARPWACSHSTSLSCLASNSAFHAPCVAKTTPFATRLLPILLLMIWFPSEGRRRGWIRGLPPFPQGARKDGAPSLCSALSPSCSVFERGVVVALPAEVASRFMNGLRYIAEVGGHVMLEAFAADVLEQLLELRNLRHACAAEGLHRIDGGCA